MVYRACPAFSMCSLGLGFSACFDGHSCVCKSSTLSRRIRIHASLTYLLVCFIETYSYLLIFFLFFKSSQVKLPLIKTSDNRTSFYNNVFQFSISCCKTFHTIQYCVPFTTLLKLKRMTVTLVRRQLHSFCQDVIHGPCIVSASYM